jgi:hypothetical protein
MKYGTREMFTDWRCVIFVLKLTCTVICVCVEQDMELETITRIDLPLGTAEYGT